MPSPDFCHFDCLWLFLKDKLCEYAKIPFPSKILLHFCRMMLIIWQELFLDLTEVIQYEAYF